jgi:hypothetical protein
MVVPATAVPDESASEACAKAAGEQRENAANISVLNDEVKLTLIYLCLMAHNNSLNRLSDVDNKILIGTSP